MSYRNDYTELRDRHAKELDGIDIRCALTDKSFEDMFAAWNLPLKKEGFSKVLHLGNNCYIRRADYPRFVEVTNRHEKEMADFMAKDEGLEQAMIYEFCNYEAMFSEDSYDTALRELDIDPEKMSEREKRIYKSARRKFWDLCIKNDWF